MMSDKPALYWIYSRGLSAYADSRASRRRCRSACHEAELLRAQLSTLCDQVSQQLSRSRGLRPHPRSTQPSSITPR
jgi:hypothetical protein